MASATPGDSYWTKRRKIIANVNKHFANSSSHVSMEYDVETVPLSTQNVCVEHPKLVTDDSKRDNTPDQMKQQSDNDSVDRQISESLDSDVSNLNTDGISESDRDEDVLGDQLRVWASTHSISMAALSSLLKILKPEHPELPADARTLMCTPRNISLTSMKNDSLYHHFGIKTGIEKLLETFPSSDIQKQFFCK